MPLPSYAARAGLCGLYDKNVVRCLSAILLALVLPLPGCRRSGVQLHLDESYPSKLSDWGLFRGRLADLQPNDGVIPYDVNTPLFSDYATKRRTVWMPPGTSATYVADSAFQFSIGTILSKTFSYPQSNGERLVETRLLVRMTNGWVGLPYVWNTQQTDAFLDTSPESIRIQWKHPGGREYSIDYQIPNVNQCKVCHDGPGGAEPLGLKAANLNRDRAYEHGSENQLGYWARIGILKGAPSPEMSPKFAVWDDPRTGSVEQRARAYLDVNCASCHREGGRGAKSGLFLDAGERIPRRFGVCKAPAEPARAAGGRLDIVPGKPHESALLSRMIATDADSRMPDLGHSVIHKEAIGLIRAWIATVPGSCP